MTTDRLKRMDGIIRNSFGFIAAVLLFLLMTVTCIDVVGRYALGKPLPGAFELSEVILAMIVYASLPLVTLHGEHVSIDLLDRYVPESLVGVQRFGTSLLVACILLLVAYSLLLKTSQIFNAGMRTDTLFIPLGVVALLMTGATIVSALIAIMLSFERASPEARLE